jgi:hypothetical protein
LTALSECPGRGGGNEYGATKEGATMKLKTATDLQGHYDYERGLDVVVPIPIPTYRFIERIDAAETELAAVKATIERLMDVVCDAFLFGTKKQRDAAEIFSASRAQPKESA